jgi:hypothetical protein
VRAADTEELLVHEPVQHIKAGGGIDIPQPARLREREAQTGHLHVLTMNALQKGGV